MALVLGSTAGASSASDGVGTLDGNNVFGNMMGMNGDEYVLCARCRYGGCDVRVLGCGCTVHARCIQLSETGPLKSCPICKKPTPGLTLFPMSFREVDEARKTAATLSRSNHKRSRKRKNLGDGAGSLLGDDSITGTVSSSSTTNSDRRTGRWTNEEMTFVDHLCGQFQNGQLPLVNGTKLNEFLSNMLKSKQSRLTKKMKNAKLSSKAFQRTSGYIVSDSEAQSFSDAEESFFHSIQCNLERAEIKFHMQREWREAFSNFCVFIGQPLDADNWLTSVEELDRRASLSRNAARLAKRKLMTSHALRHDSQNPIPGVFIETSNSDLHENDRDRIASVAAAHGITSETEEFLTLLSDKSIFHEGGNSYYGGMFGNSTTTTGGVSGGVESLLSNHGRLLSQQKGSTSVTTSPFLAKVLNYAQRHGIPFEHIDAWVPSFLPQDGDNNNNNNNSSNNNNNSPSCRLCFAGSATSDMETSAIGSTAMKPLSAETLFNLQAFGEYSEKFSFDVGCGLPGRVYQTGIPSWEQSVHNAPLNHFERCGGAVQWGIRTVVGIPIPSPNVGRIVVLFYSCHDRERNQDIVGRLCTEMARLMPTPKWKLVVELGEPSCARPVQQTKEVSDTTPVTSTQTSSQAQTIDLHQQANSTSMNNTAVVSSSSSTASVKATGSNTVKETNNNSTNSQGKDSRIQEVISILGEYMPSDPKSPLVSYLPGFMSLRLMLLRSQWSPQESEIIDTMLGSYSSYTASGRTREDIAVLLARDCMFLQAQNVEVPQQTNNANTNNPTPNPTLSSSHSSPFSTSQQPPSQQQQQHNMFHHTQQSQSPFGLHSPNIGPSSNPPSSSSSASAMMNNKHHNHHTHHMQQQAHSAQHQMHPPSSPSDSNSPLHQAGASPLLNGQSVSSCFDFNPPTLSHDSLSIVSN